MATITIKLPSPQGYVNLGDGFVILAGCVLSPFYGFLAAGIGSALADLLLGFAAYSPATFIIKGLMTVVTYFVFKLLRKNTNSIVSGIVAALSAELIMISGYFLFETILYGSMATAAASVLFNCTQGFIGLIVGTILIYVFEKTNFLK